MLRQAVGMESTSFATNRTPSAANSTRRSLSLNDAVLTGKFAGGGNVSVTLGRDLDMPLTLTATIQSTIPDADALNPSCPKNENIKEVRYSPLITMGCNPCSTGASQPACVIGLPGDEVIVAGSEYYHAFQQGPGAIGSKDGAPAGVSKEAYSAAYQPNRSCVTVGYSALSVDESHWCEVGYLSVDVFIAVPNHPDHLFHLLLRSRCTATLAGLRTFIRRDTGRIDTRHRPSSTRCPRHQAGMHGRTRSPHPRQCVR
jgi:hypothetical protein